MGYRFRKSMKLGPLRFTLSKSGLSASVGVKGLRVTKMANGRTRTTASIPGTGISYVKESSAKKKQQSAPRPAPVPIAERPPEPPVCETLLDVAAAFLGESEVSAALLQRRCKISYTRACKIIDGFARAGLIGAYRDGGTREVLYDAEDLRDEELRDVLAAVRVADL